MDNVALAAAYRIHATIFRMNAEVLLKDFESKGEKVQGNPRALPFYYLISHAMELLLKSAILKRKDNVKRTHDLAELCAELIEIGVPISQKCGNVIIQLGLQHKEHRLRYTALIEGNPIWTPEPSKVLETMDEILMMTRISTHGI